MRVSARKLILALTAVLLLGACGGSDVAVLDPPSATGGTASPELDFDEDGSASFEIVGDRAFMGGVIDGDTPEAVEELLTDHPGVMTIELVTVPGSDDDEANLEAALLVRDAGLATHVAADGEIASGGVDFFLAGTERSYEAGARFGVHSWSTGDDAFHALDLDEDDPEHDRYLDYYDEIDVDEDFYWFTLEAAPPEDIHWMTETELERYGFATN
ncbi:MAG: alpha/beta hydrolase [Actinomycetota bacterium]